MSNWIDPFRFRPSCPGCEGYGEDANENECEVCEGKGVAERDAAERFLTDQANESQS